MFGKRWMIWGFVAVVAVLGQWPQGAPAQQFVTENPPPPTYAEVVVDVLNVRATPADDGDKLGQLKKGDLVPVKKVKDGWVQLAWTYKAYVFEKGVRIPEGDINKKPRYDDMREAFIDYIEAQDSTIVDVQIPRQSGITVRYHWKEYRDKAALIKRTEELARIYSNMTTGEKGITVDIISGNESWARAFY